MSVHAAMRLRLSALPGRPMLLLDPLARRASLAGRDCPIVGRAFDLLWLLAQTPSVPQAAEDLRLAVWPDRVVENTNLRAQIHLLRSVLGSAAIDSSGRRGYALVAEAVPPEGLDSAGPANHHDLAAAAAPAEGQLLGRADDVARLRELLHGHRLVTLLGPAGVGKSRLARHVLAPGPTGATGPVAWVDLAEVPTAPPDLTALARAMGAALSMAPAANGAGWLVLDNAEHHAGPAGGLATCVRRLLDAEPSLRVLVTSQRPLQLPGEAQYRLAPLPLPPRSGDPALIQHNPAVRLLFDRAAAADQRFALGETEWSTAADIAHRLDGLPLALELAGARLPLLGVALLADRLADPLQLLGSTARARPSRHTSLRAAVDASLGLLAPAEQQALMVLSMFAMPFRAETALALLGASGIDTRQATLSLQALVEQSVLLPSPQTEGAEPGPTAARLHLLAGHRAWGQDALRRRGVEARRRLQACYAELMAGMAAGRLHPATNRPTAKAHRGDLLQALEFAEALGDGATAQTLRAGLDD